MKELFCTDSSEVLVNLELPLVQEARLSEALNESVDAVIAVLGLSDHVGAMITHLVCIPGKTSWQGGLMAARGDQVYVLASLFQPQDRLVKFMIFEFSFLFVCKLHVLS